jgi:DeoR/GlpR family transcriptional regulator of sugar metabolism
MKRNDMLAQDRRQKILELLREEGSARVSTLSDLFNVSEPTVRQDLERLEQEGYIVREHGGAYLRSINHQVRSLSLEHTENLDKKTAVGEKAAEFIQNGDRIILDSGSTVTEVARHLHGKQDLTVITNALNIALILGVEHAMEVLVTGGEFKPPTLSLTGEKASAFFKNMYVDKLFLATGGISPSFELTYPGFSDLPVKRAMVEAASETYLVADSTKIGKTSFASLGVMNYVNYFITDSDIPADIVSQIEEMGTTVITT